MSQKTRNEITSVIGSNIFDNNNKEILASMVRSVLNDFRDSYFNLKDDELKNVNYNDTQTLEQYLNSVVGAIPLWGSTDFFDPSSPNGDIQTYSDKGIVSSMQYLNSSDARSEITIHLTKSIANRKISVAIITDRQSPALQANFCAPVIYRIGSKLIKIGLRQVGGGMVDKIRLEITANKTTT